MVQNGDFWCDDDDDDDDDDDNNNCNDDYNKADHYKTRADTSQNMAYSDI